MFPLARLLKSWNTHPVIHLPAGNNEMRSPTAVVALPGQPIGAAEADGLRARP